MRGRLQLSSSYPAPPNFSIPQMPRHTGSPHRTIIVHMSRKTLRIAAAVFCAIALSAQTPNSAAKGKTVADQARGAFDVKLKPLPLEGEQEGSLLARMSIDKQFHGDLDASSKGEMLSAGTSVKGSAGYVAIERVTGKLHTRTGTFVLQHSGTLNRGEPQLSITVVPDSGTGQLAGLTGKMQIDITGGKHSYIFDYMLPE